MSIEESVFKKNRITADRRKDFGQTTRVVQSHRFANPVVRFRRVRGRVIPIYGKQRIAKGISEAGKYTALGGAALAASGAVRIKTKEGIVRDKKNAIIKKNRVGARLKKKLFTKTPKNPPRGFLKNLGNASFGAAKKIIKSPKASITAGAAIAATGAAAYLYGAIKQSETELGFDIGGNRE